MTCVDKRSAGAILLAAGNSRRMGGQDKLLLPLAGRPLITYALRALEQAEEVEQVVVVLAEHNAEAILPLLRPFKKVTHTCMGGPRRQDSVRNGLYTLPAFDWIVVHDGARPFVTPALIRRGLEAARRFGAAAAAVPVADTLKAAQADGVVLRTVSREGLWAVQTPQVFRYDLLLMAHERVSEDVTDDCAMLERLGHPVLLYKGSRLNFKITTPDDAWLAVARQRRPTPDDDPGTAA
ncbi:MAG: 2-C-methyl-D-erythritol 4-phosphate cytidylyltransferase [Chloroflexota bacterium]